MNTVRIRAKGEKAKAMLRAVAEALSIEKIDAVVDRAAFETQGSLIRKTPKRWFGQVRRSWLVSKIAPGARVVFNENPIMLFLEEGTKDHGPRELIGPLRPGERRAKAALFIPLTRRAVNATAGEPEFGVVDQFTVKGETYWERARAIVQRRQSVRKGKVKNSKSVFVFGIDYILAKRVRGIRARHIVASERPKAKARLRDLMDKHLRSAVKAK
jgi:hypothetical protein